MVRWVTGFRALVQHPEVPDQWLEVGPEPGGRDDGIRRDGRAPAKMHRGTVEPLDRRHDANPPRPHGGNEAGIENRNGPGAQELRGRNNVLGSLADAPPSEPPARHEIRDGQIYRWFE